MRRKGGREGEKPQCAIPPLGTWPATEACALTRNQNSDLSVLRLVLNPLNHTSQGMTISFSFCIL